MDHKYLPLLIIPFKEFAQRESAERMGPLLSALSQHGVGVGGIPIVRAVLPFLLRSSSMIGNVPISESGDGKPLPGEAHPSDFGAFYVSDSANHRPYGTK